MIKGVGVLVGRRSVAQAEAGIIRVQRRIQSDLFFDYQSNVASYPGWQAWLRQHRPPVLIVWGRYDPSFALDGAMAYRKAVPDAEVNIFDAGHFALDEKVDEIAVLMNAFLAKHVRGPDERHVVGRGARSTDAVALDALLPF